MQTPLRWGLFAALAMMLGNAGAAQEKVQAIILAPQDGALFGWAQQPPTVTIEAALQRGEEPLRPSNALRRLFLSAQIRQDERLIDTVPLWDDGTHGDKKANDGVFTALYRPPQEGTFQIRIRAQAEVEEEGKTVTREFWSGIVSFRVVSVPYPRLTYPEPGSRLGQKVTVRARLLLHEKPFEQDDETLQAVLQIVREGWSHQVPMQRRGSLLTAPVTFPQQGRYRMVVRTSVQREGQTLPAESEPTEVEVVRPKLGWLIAAIVAFVIFLLLPPREPPLRYHHRVRINGAEVVLHPPEFSATRSAGECQVEVKGERQWREITVTVKTPSGRTRTETLAEGERRTVTVEGESVQVHYTKAEPHRDPVKVWHRLLPNTFPRAVFLLLAAAAFVYWLWQWRQFAQ